MNYFTMGEYDVIVIGAGHAGCEAGLASARMGMKTLLLSINLEAVNSAKKIKKLRNTLKERRPWFW